LSVTEAEPAGERTWQWCGTTAAAAVETCPSCGAALAERDSIGDLVLPGVTNVDPALAAYDAQPWRLPKNSPSQGIAGGSMAAAAMGGPAGLAALGGLAAVAAVEYLAAGRKDGGATLAPEDVGRPSDAALQMLEKLRATVGDGESPEGDNQPAEADAAPEARD
jgi:hypothetical protein